MSESTVFTKRLFIDGEEIFPPTPPAPVVPNVAYGGNDGIVSLGPASSNVPFFSAPSLEPRITYKADDVYDISISGRLTVPANVAAAAGNTLTLKCLVGGVDVSTLAIPSTDYTLSDSGFVGTNLTTFLPVTFNWIYEPSAALPGDELLIQLLGTNSSSVNLSFNTENMLVSVKRVN